MNKYRIKDKNKNINVMLSLALNILFFVVVIMVTLFVTSFNFDALLPRWEVWTRLPAELQGFWPWQKGVIEVVAAGTPRAYFQPGVVVISGLIQIIGFMLFLNTKWGKKLKLTLERVYLRNTYILNKFRYLISDDLFRSSLGHIDLTNKKDAWLILVQEKLQKFSDKIPRYVTDELLLDDDKKSKKTKKWIEKENKMKEQLTAEWIDANIHRLKFDYPRINVKMVVNGVTNIDVARMAITDVKSIERKENQSKLIFALLSFVIVSIFAGLSFPAFRQDVWMLIKDFVVYGAALIMNIILGNSAANVVHESRIQETEDRKGYIEAFVGDAKFRQIETEVDNSIKKVSINTLEDELRYVKHED